MKTKYLIIVFLCISILGKAQISTYDISTKNKHIGQLTITKTTEKNLIKIEVHSEVHVDFHISIDFKYRLTTIYRNDTLAFSSVTTYVNGKQHSSKITEKTGNNYSITKNGINLSSTLQFSIQEHCCTGRSLLMW